MNKLELIPVTEDNWVPTSFHGIVIPAKPSDLIKLLGEPDYTDDDRTQWQWDRILTHEGQQIYFIVYDYKEDMEIEEHTHYDDWLIGTENKDQAFIVANLLTLHLSQL